MEPSLVEVSVLESELVPLDESFVVPVEESEPESVLLSLDESVEVSVVEVSVVVLSR